MSNAVSDTVSDGLVSGFNGILKSVTNQFFDMAGMNSTQTTVAFTNAMVAPNDFLSNPFIQAQKDFTAFWFAIFYLAFLLIGGILLFKEEASKGDGMGVEGSPWRNRYITTAVAAPMLWAFYLIGLKWLFSLEYLMAKSAFLDLTEFMPLDNGSNAISYFFLGIMIIINIIFFSIRYMIVGIVAGWFLLSVIAWFFPLTKTYGKLLLYYGALMLFSRFVVVLIIVGGFGLIKGVGVSIIPFSYVLVLLLAVIFELLCLLYPIIYAFTHSDMKVLRIIKVRR